MAQKKITKLVKTDYDNFKNLSFFLEQQRMAEEMLKDVEEFKKSFVLSKMTSLLDFFKENPLYELKFFAEPQLVIWFTDERDIIGGYIKLNTGNFISYFNRNGKKGVYWEDYYDKNINFGDVYDKLPARHKTILKKFYEAIHEYNHLYVSNDKKLYYTKSSRQFSENKEKVYVDESNTLFIIDNWKDYVNVEELEKSLKKNNVSTERYHHSRDDYDEYYVNGKRVYRGLVGNIYNRTSGWTLFKYKELYDYMENVRFREATDLLKSIYTKRPEDMALNWCEHNFERFRPDIKGNCFVIHENKPVWVTNHPKDVKITTNKNRTVIKCEFNNKIEFREYMFPSDGPVTVMTRNVTLTYAAEDNELKNVNVYCNKSKYKRQYDY